MSYKLLQKSLFTVTLCLGIIQPSSAHVIWFPAGQGGYDLWLSEFDDPSSLSYDTAGLISIKALDSTGNEIPATIQATESPISIVPSSPPAALKTSYDRAYWIKDDSAGFDVDHEFANYLGYLTPTELATMGYGNVVHHLRDTKALYQWSAILAQPFGQTLEAIPLTNPFTLQPGDNLPIEVLFQGQPVSDADVVYLNEKITADSNGIFNIPIDSAGLQPIEIDYSTPQTSDTALTYYGASLTVSSAAVPEPSSIAGSILGAVGVVFFARQRLKK